MKAIIIEDEPRAASRLERLISEVDSSIHIVTCIETIEDGIAFLKNNRVDLIFSDIQLADGLSFEIYTLLDSLPPIIFTTAYDQYAINAFKTNGIDYLLKPIEPKELESAINKLKALTKPSIDSSILLALSNQLNTDVKTYKERFMIKVGQHLKSLSSTEIQAFYSLDKATYIFTNENRNYILDYSLEHLEDILSPKKFFRINRKLILNIDANFEITSWSNSRLKITLSGLDGDLLIVARNRVKEFKQWLGEV